MSKQTAGWASGESKVSCLKSRSRSLCLCASWTARHNSAAVACVLQHLLPCRRKASYELARVRFLLWAWTCNPPYPIHVLKRSEVHVCASPDILRLRILLLVLKFLLALAVVVQARDR